MSGRSDIQQVPADIVAMVSHDLRGPLNVIAVNAALIETVLSQQGIDLDVVRRRFEAIHRARKRMERLIEDLLDFGSMCRGALAVELRDESVASLVRQAADEAGSDASAKRLDVRVSASVGQVHCDRDRIMQVFSNLTGNAIKFTPVGGTISIGATKESMGDWRLFVSDTGSGIAENEIPLVFERFWRSRQNRRGLGLGLAIAKAIVEAHRGRIWIESEAGAGSTFYFTLPNGVR